jgi:hypothetical protein
MHQLLLFLVAIAFTTWFIKHLNLFEYQIYSDLFVLPRTKPGKYAINPEIHLANNKTAFTIKKRRTFLHFINSSKAN